VQGQDRRRPDRARAVDGRAHPDADPTHQRRGPASAQVGARQPPTRRRGGPRSGSAESTRRRARSRAPPLWRS
jgi:hypothetical protein